MYFRLDLYLHQEQKKKIKKKNRGTEEQGMRFFRPSKKWAGLAHF
jgi:hypothetical protein